MSPGASPGPTRSRCRGPATNRRSVADAAFGREVELIRRHLAPLRNRRSLTASFGREAFQSLDAWAPGTRPLGPIRVAYAIRRLELGSGMCLPPWSRLLAPDAP